MSYKNKEGYPDPTAGLAIRNATRSLLVKDPKQHKKAREAKRFKMIYVASPYAGDVHTNTENAKRYSRFVIHRGNMPVTPHLLYPQIMDDTNTRERFIGRMFGLVLLRHCKEVWVFGDVISEGMATEIKVATHLNKRIRYFSSDLKEV